MFSTNQKRAISEAVQKALRESNCDQLPQDEIRFKLEVIGSNFWNFETIRNMSDPEMQRLKND